MHTIWLLSSKIPLANSQPIVIHHFRSMRREFCVRNLGSADEIFVENVNCDVRRFIKRYTKNCVLIFPPVSSFHRFLIHQTCESLCQEYDLCTFSIGQGYYRRTVVCFRSQVLDPSKLTTHQTPSTSSEIRHQKPIENWRSTNASNSIQTKSSYDRWNTGSKMGVGNNGSDNREHKLNSVERQQSLSSRNRYEFPQTAEIPPNQTSMLHHLIANNSSASCNSSTIHGNETECPQSPVVTEDDLSTTTTTTSTMATTTAAISPLPRDQQSRVQTARRERRPDRAVYIPRARRSQTTPPTTTATIITANTAAMVVTNTRTTGSSTTTTVSSSSSSSSSGYSNGNNVNHQKCNSIILGANVNETVNSTQLTKVDEISKKKSKTSGSSSNPTVVTGSSTLTSTASNPNVKERRIERHRKSLEKSKSNSQKEKEITTQKTPKKDQDCDRKQQQRRQEEREYNHHETTASNTNQMRTIQPIQSVGTATDATTDKIISTNEMNPTKNKNLKQFPSSLPESRVQTVEIVQNGVADDLSKRGTHPVHKTSHVLIEEIVSNGEPSSSKCDIDQEELQRASKEINRSNRRIMKQTFVSDVLEIPDKVEHTHEHDIHLRTAISSVSSPTSTAVDSTTEDEEDDWESKYDESGDCLDPRALEELEYAVGKVKITTPKTDYSAFLTNQAILNDEEFPHVLEVSNFPVEFKNQDLLMVFSQYKESGFDIKWVDDTHALAVFSSSRIAAEVLTMGHPFVVLKPLAEATLESRLKAKKCASSLQPYRQRPETCAALARRLVTGALGVRLETAAAERENEKRVLRKAKERKLLAARQRDEAWES